MIFLAHLLEMMIIIILSPKGENNIQVHFFLVTNKFFFFFFLENLLAPLRDLLVRNVCASPSRYPLNRSGERERPLEKERKEVA